MILTDVAAEGLDLQRAARVVHYDLPWTPMKLEQREGRSVRLGSRHSGVDIVRFAPDAELDRFMCLEAALTRKAKLPAAAGLGPEGRHVWRWRTEVAREFGGSDTAAGVARVSSRHRGVLVGISLHRVSDPATLLTSIAGWVGPDGRWIEDAQLIVERLRLATACHVEDTLPGESRMYLELLTPLLRKRLALARSGHWISPRPTAGARAAAVRLNRLIRGAARLRDDHRLSQLEQALAFVAGGHTAGEEMALERLSEVSDDELTAGLTQTVPQPNWDGVEVRLTGFIVFGPPETMPSSGLPSFLRP
jgi:hypothetical protein